jgi:hypothetical protein
MSDWHQTPFDVLPLHIQGQDNYACANPEQPYGLGVRLDLRCRSCYVWALAAVKSGVDRVEWWRHYDDLEQRSLSEVVALNAPFHGLEHLLDRTIASEGV